MMMIKWIQNKYNLFLFKTQYSIKDDSIKYQTKNLTYNSYLQFAN
jgi:hypothetical protein